MKWATDQLHQLPPPLRHLDPLLLLQNLVLHNDEHTFELSENHISVEHSPKTEIRFPISSSADLRSAYSRKQSKTVLSRKRIVHLVHNYS